MADDDWYKPYRSPAPPRQSKHGEHIWTLRRNGRRVDCELRFHGESYGWECQCLHDGELAYGQRYVLHQAALEEAEAQRQRLITAGWSMPTTA